MANRIKLGELLVRAGVIDDQKLNIALAEQKRWGGRLGKILVDMRFLSEDLLIKALSKQLGVPRATFDNMNVPSEMLRAFGADFGREHGMCPEHYDSSRGILTVAMVDPTNIQAIDEARFRTGKRIDAKLGGERAILQAIDRFIGGGLSMFDNLTDSRQERRSSGSFTPEVASANAPRSPPTDSEAPTANPANPSSTAATLEANRVLEAQRHAHRAVHALVDLLVEKRVFSRDEYLARLNRMSE